MLDALFKPRSVAVVGASNNPFSIGHIVIQNLVDHNFKGPIYPINPKSRVIKSFRAFPSLAEVPDEVDLVNISIKNTLVPMVLEDCGKKGVKFAIVHTAGFKEVGEEGIKLEKQIVEVAHKYGMRIYGPNSQGIQNSDPEVSVYANFTFVPMTPGNISIVAQSGGVGETLKLQLYQIGMGIRMYSSFGNEADVSMNEIIDYFGQDEQTKVIMTHIETLKDPAGFLEMAQRVTPHTPILALKTGRTKEGVSAVASHTGSLIEQDTLSDEIFDKSGVMRFDTQQDMIEAAIALSTQPVPKSSKTCIVTNTGGPAIIAVDEGVKKGLKLAALSDQTKKDLGELLFSEAIVSNPVDVVATAGADEYGGTVEILLRDPNIDSIIMNFVTPPFVDCDKVAQKLAEVTASADKPLVCIVLTLEEKFGEVVRLIRNAGIPVFDFPESAARAVVSMVKYGQIQNRSEPIFPDHATNKAKAESILSKYAGEEKFLPQDEVFELLDAYGIPAARSAKVGNLGSLKQAAADMTYPLVLKVDSEEVVHKSDVGGVKLNLADENALVAAYDEMSAKFTQYNPQWLLQEQLNGDHEVIMGLKANDGGLNSSIMFGLGGVFVETLKDVQFRLAPLSEQEAFDMIKSIKGYPILEGARGMADADTDKLAEILIRLSRLAADFPSIDEMDLNPVFAFEKGKGAAVVDARLKTRKV
jgi:acetyltransferase